MEKENVSAECHIWQTSFFIISDVCANVENTSLWRSRAYMNATRNVTYSIYIRVHQTPLWNERDHVSSPLISTENMKAQIFPYLKQQIVMNCLNFTSSLHYNLIRHEIKKIGVIHFFPQAILG